MHGGPATAASDLFSFSLAETVTLSLTASNALQELIDSDDLLDPEDLKKPDPASLRAASCGEGKKRTACRNWWVLARAGLHRPPRGASDVPGIAGRYCY